MDWKKLINYSITVALLLLTVLLVENYGPWAAIWLLIVGIAFAGWRLYLQWDGVMTSIRYMETLIWGKPLDKDMWKKGEKIPKVRFKWGKKE